ncbi:ankyrin repeat-containing domain protein [Hypoxylon sp. NC0597]|nr:ankyrin repeat-containing domain protein [Hypoxylon sp. NC0597]
MLVYDLIMTCFANWSMQVACNELLLLFLGSDMWPVTWKLVRTAILSETVFGSFMRSMVVRCIEEARNGNLYSYLRDIASLTPALSAIFVISKRDASVWESEIEAMLSWDLRQLLGSFYQFWVWKFESFLIILITKILTMVVEVGYSRIRGRKGAHTMSYGGTSALRAILSFPGNSERVAIALLEHGIFSAEYVKKSLQNPDSHASSWAQEPSLVRGLWGWSLSRGDEQIVSALLDLGVSVNEPSSFTHSLWYAASQGHDGVVGVILQKGNERNGLTAEDIQQALIACTRTYYDFQNETTFKSNERTFYLLLDQVEYVGDHATQSGFTALSYAVANGNVPAVEALLKKGANVDTKDKYGRTPLLYLRPDGPLTSSNTATPLLRILLEAGANIDHQDNKGYTILLRQIELDDRPTAKLLLDNGADPNRTLEDGETAIQLAARSSTVGMMKDLIDAGARLEDGLEPESAPLVLLNRNIHQYIEATSLSWRKAFKRYQEKINSTT